MIRSVYRLKKAGNLNDLKITQEELSSPGIGEVQITIRAIGLNFADIFAVKGLYGATPEGSFIPGLEYSGVINAIGKGVEGIRIGEEIMGVTRFGSYASHLNIDADYITSLPNNWTLKQGAAFLVQGLTAYYGLFELGNLDKDSPKTILIHSAAGGVGLLANRMAKKMNAYTIGTVGSAKKVALLKEENYDDFIIRGKNFRRQLASKLEGRELNLIMECIGGNVLKAGFDLLAPQGRMINYGSAQYADNANRPNWIRLAWLYIKRPRIDVQKMIETNKAILGFNLIWLYHNKPLLFKSLDALIKLQLAPPIIGHEYDFNDLPAALRAFQSGQTIGKVIVNL